jgi:hypothetical protein
LFQREPRAEEVRLAVEFVGGRQDAREASAKLSPAAAKAELTRREAKQEERRKEKMAQLQKPGNKKASARAPIQNEGERVVRKPLTVWEEYAQALLFANEMAYVN